MESSWLALTAMITTVFFLVCHLIIKLDKKKRQLQLPPGPFDVPIISGLLWLCKPFSEVEPTIRKLHARYGPIVAIPFGSRRVILISGRSLTHEALVQNGAVFADRPLDLATRKIMSCNQQNISSGFYGPTWRLLRRNLASEILNPSRVKSYAGARKWVLDILIKNLMESQTTSKANNGVILRVADHFQYAMFCLLVLMCFGDKLDEKQIKQIEHVQRNLLLSFWRFNILNIWPSLTKIVFKKRWEEFFQLKKDQEQVFLPLIDARKEIMKISNGHDDYVLAYADTLCDLELPYQNRKLNEDEIICLCSEFLSAGTDTTTTALQWIMANIVKYPMIQEKILTEMKGVVGEKEEEVKEEDLQKMPYLKAVILEGLRRHPPGHYLLPHSVTQDVVFDGYMVPKNAIISFLVADIGWDPEVWEDPMEFKPERFLSQGEGGFDITGSREIKMMPFGVGRRMCPALGLALLHLEYFVANLVWKFEWDAVEGDNVDLSEKQEFTMVMKNPLKARISPRVMK